MKSNFFAILLLITCTLNSVNFAKITGTAHDFSKETRAPAENKMCAVVFHFKQMTYSAHHVMIHIGTSTTTSWL